MESSCSVLKDLVSAIKEGEGAGLPPTCMDLAHTVVAEEQRKLAARSKLRDALKIKRNQEVILPLRCDAENPFGFLKEENDFFLCCE